MPIWMIGSMKKLRPKSRRFLKCVCLLAYIVGYLLFTLYYSITYYKLYYIHLAFKHELNSRNCSGHKLKSSFCVTGSYEMRFCRQAALCASCMRLCDATRKAHWPTSGARDAPARRLSVCWTRRYFEPRSHRVTHFSREAGHSFGHWVNWCSSGPVTQNWLQHQTQQQNCTAHTHICLSKNVIYIYNLHRTVHTMKISLLKQFSFSLEICHKLANISFCQTIILIFVDKMILKFEQRLVLFWSFILCLIYFQ